jgi:hypothetical protein
MRKDLLVAVLCLLSVFLVSCATGKSSRTMQKKGELEYGRLVMMGDEFVAWFSPEKNLIGSNDMEQYFQKYDIEPVEPKVLEHFASLGWEVVKKYKTDKYTTEYQLKRIVE